MTTYTLKKCTYLCGDPAMIIKKTEDGDRVIRQLWDTFYLDMQAFQHLMIQGVDLYITRTAEGDGVYQGVGTDTGTLMLICVDDHLNDERLNLTLHRPGMKTLELEDQSTVTVNRFNISFSNGITIITNSDDMR
jgi:hypothetical protein